MAKRVRRKRSNDKKLICVALILFLVFMTLAIGLGAFLFTSSKSPAKNNHENRSEIITSNITEDTNSYQESEYSEENSSETEPDKNASNNDPQNSESNEESKENSSSEESSEESEEEENENKTGSNIDYQNTKKNIWDDSTLIPEENINYNFPNEMKAVFITAGEDFCKSPDDTEEQIKADIDKALKNAASFDMNSLIFTTKANEKAIYERTIFPCRADGFDALAYAIQKAREDDFFVYAVYDANDIIEDNNITTANIINSENLDIISANLKLFCENYHFDGIIIDNYYNNNKEDSFNQYINYGGGVGYDAYMKNVAETLFDTCARIIRHYSPETQIGMMTEPVWKNKTETDTDGSETSCGYSVYYDGNFDSLDILDKGIAHFVMVKAPGSTIDKNINFKNVAQWWGKQAEESGVSYYILHSSSKMATDNPGWSEYDQLIKQAMVCEDINAFNGSAFDSLSRMVEDPKNSATNLLKYYHKEINPNHVLKELAVTNPKKLNFETFEKSVTFTGASDPNTDVTINGKQINTDQNGYFSVTFNLNPGNNNFKIVHKGKQVNYSIYRRIVIIKEFSPTGNLSVDGETQITVSALAYADAKITASLAGQSVALQISDTQDDNTDLNSDYVLFEGIITVPKAAKKDIKLGNITFNGNWNGMIENKTAANVTINKLLAIADGIPVEIIANSAETFPTNVINDYSAPSYYPLPKGSKDYVLGNEIVYNDGAKRFSYYKLASNVRVYKDDIKAIPDTEAPNKNKINSAKITSDKNYTYVTVNMNQKVTYTVNYTGNSIAFKFNYTQSAPSNVAVETNPLFSSASFTGQTLTINFAKPGTFLGYFAYFNGDNLVLRFNNPPKISGNSLKGVRVVIDSGHGGQDPGKVGFLPAYPESVIVREISTKLYYELKARGADVKLIYTTSGKLVLKDRMEIARKFNPHVLVSVHANSANSSVTGTEAFYFYPFSKNLASYMAQNVSKAVNTTNRGGKFSYMYMTRDSQFASTLVEVGFLSNSNEYKKLISESYQDKIAVSIANSIASYIKSVSTNGNYGNDSDSSYNPDDDSSGNGDIISSDNNSHNSDSIEKIKISESELTLDVGKSSDLDVKIVPKSAEKQNILWYSDNEDIVKVSKTGKVTALAPGEAVVIAETEDGKHSDECFIKVKGKSKDKLSLSLDVENNDLYVDDETEIIAFLSNGTNCEVKWDYEEIDGTDVIEFDFGEDYAFLTALNPGKVKITAQLRTDNKIKASTTITVK